MNPAVLAAAVFGALFVIIFLALHFFRGEMVRCTFCSAVVPWSCADTHGSGYERKKRVVCHVCSGERSEYPRRTEEIPGKEQCLCQQNFYPNGFMNFIGCGWACLQCLRATDGEKARP